MRRLPWRSLRMVAVLAIDSARRHLRIRRRAAVLRWQHHRPQRSNADVRSATRLCKIESTKCLGTPGDRCKGHDQPGAVGEHELRPEIADDVNVFVWKAGQNFGGEILHGGGDV